MALEPVSAIEGDLARVSAATSQLATAEALQHASADPKANDVAQAQAAVAAAQAQLAQAQAALHADQAAAPQTDTTPHFVTDPGGIVV